MFTGNVLSSTRILAPIIGARRKTINDFVDYEDGGIGLNDSSAGLLYQEWTTMTDGTDIWISSPNTLSTLIYTGTNIVGVSCTFDQNMNPVYAITEDGQAKLRWYDSTIEDYAVTNLGGAWPKVFLDDKRPEFIATSDIIVAYVSSGTLYFRMQRDRYGVEYTLATGIGCYGRMKNLGMGRNNRLQFVLSVDDYMETCFGFDPTDPYEVSELVN